MAAYYNEIDPYAAQWLRNLIAGGHIASGDVDERDIREVQPGDLVGYRQCHFFAGVGGWSCALRLAGVPDETPVWTGSCPCPPFSAAGKEKACPACGGSKPVPHVGRTGYFVCCLCGHEWLADERHLWPELWRLVRDGRPSVLLGEQVASRDGRTWLSLVRASLEILSYACWGADICAAGVGAPHVRQRLWLVAHATRTKHAEDTVEGRYRERSQIESGRGSSVGELGDTGEQGLARRQGQRQDDGEKRQASERTGATTGELGYAESECLRESSEQTGRDNARRTGEARNPWSDCDWIWCTDGKWRPAIARDELLASGLSPDVAVLCSKGAFPKRAAMLKGFGNSINIDVAKAFIIAVMGDGNVSLQTKETEWPQNG